MCLMQTFSSNMSVKGKPVLKPAKKETFTCVTFKPDLAKFGMIVLEEQTISLMRKRVYDLAGVLGKTVKVTTPHLRGDQSCMVPQLRGLWLVCLQIVWQVLQGAQAVRESIYKILLCSHERKGGRLEDRPFSTSVR